MTYSRTKKILLVDDDDLFRESIRDFLQEAYTVQEANSGEQALEVLAGSSPELVLLDINLPRMSGIRLLSKIKKRWADMPVIMITALNSVPEVVQSVKQGAFDYLVKPINVDELFLAVERALESSEVRSELQQRRTLQLTVDKSIQLVGVSPATEKLRQEIQKVAETEITVLIEGETGTGKELIARSIHACSPRAEKPFVAINCGAMPENLMESELFGHKKGAFTGALKDGAGKFQLAHRGTLLLDEVGELPPAAQVKLLRVLEKQEFYPVGASELVNVDVRVIASTNKNLKALVEQEKFRADLLFRLNVYTLDVPPLRERPQDIIAIADHFLEHYGKKFGKKNLKFSAGATEMLLSHPWKGNGRELRNLIERVVLFPEGKVIKKEHINFIEDSSPRRLSAKSIRLPEDGIDFEEVEKSLISQALKLANYNKTKAARLLNLSAPTFYYRLEKYGVE